MKFQTIFLREPCHGRLAVCGHSLSVGHEGISTIDFDANSQLFAVVVKEQRSVFYVPTSNVRNLVGLPVEPNVSQKGK